MEKVSASGKLILRSQLLLVLGRMFGSRVALFGLLPDNSDTDLLNISQHFVHFVRMLQFDLDLW